MSSTKYSKAIKEVTEYLKGIREEDINKIPEEFLKYLNENQAEDYTPNIDYTKPLKELNLSNETKGIISFICYNYWCENEKDKKALLDKLNENERKFQIELCEKFKEKEIYSKEAEKILPIINDENKNKPSIFAIFSNFIKRLKKKY